MYQQQQLKLEDTGAMTSKLLPNWNAKPSQTCSLSVLVESVHFQTCKSQKSASLQTTGKLLENKQTHSREPSVTRRGAPTGEWWGGSQEDSVHQAQGTSAPTWARWLRSTMKPAGELTALSGKDLKWETFYRLEGAWILFPVQIKPDKWKIRQLITQGRKKKVCTKKDIRL